MKRLARLVQSLVIMSILTPRGGLPARAGGEGPIVAVFDLRAEAKGFGHRRLLKLTDYLATLLAENGYRVVPRSQVRARLLQAKKESYRNCYDTSCQIELGRELAAQKVLRGTISVVGGKCHLLLDLYDLKKAVSEKALVLPHRCNEKDTLRALRRAAARLALETPGTGALLTWPPPCRGGTECLEDARLAERAGNRAQAYIAAVAAEMASWKEGRRGTQLQAGGLAGKIIERGAVGSRLKKVLQQACREQDLVGCLAMARYWWKVGGEPEMSAKMLKKLCAKNMAPACHDLATMTAAGENGPRDTAAATKFWQKACRGGEPRACYAEGLFLMRVSGKKRDLPRILALFEKACDWQQGEACQMAGEFRRKGLGGSADPERAEKLFRRSCKLNNQLGCLGLGKMLLAKGQVKQAGKFFSGLCALGNGDGCTWAAKILTRAERIDDPVVSRGATKQVLKYLRQACRQHSGQGCYLLARRYQAGQGVARDPQLAAELLAKACRWGALEACPGSEQLVGHAPAGTGPVSTAPAPADNAKVEAQTETVPETADSKPEARVERSSVPGKPVNWKALTFWTGMATLAVGATAGGFAWKYARDFNQSGESLGAAQTLTGVMWGAAGTAAALLITSLVLELSDDGEQPAEAGTPLPAVSVGAGSAAVTLSLRW